MGESFKRVLVVAPHPDDEVIGCGGTIAKHAAAGDEVTVCVVSEGMPPMYSYEVANQTKAEDVDANEYLGTTSIQFLGFPGSELDSVKQRELNDAICNVVKQVEPDIVYIPFSGDIHRDHKIVADACMVALRPKGKHKATQIYAYEVPSETGWDAPYVCNTFNPSVYSDIEETFGMKLLALHKIKSQIPTNGDARSAEAIAALAQFRGSTVGFKYAEAFVHVRSLI